MSGQFKFYISATLTPTMNLRRRCGTGVPAYFLPGSVRVENGEAPLFLPSFTFVAAGRSSAEITSAAAARNGSEIPKRHRARFRGPFSATQTVGTLCQAFPELRMRSKRGWDHNAGCQETALRLSPGQEGRGQACSLAMATPFPYSMWNKWIRYSFLV